MRELRFPVLRRSRLQSLAQPALEGRMRVLLLRQQERDPTQQLKQTNTTLRDTFTLKDSYRTLCDETYHNMNSSFAIHRRFTLANNEQNVYNACVLALSTLCHYVR